MDLAFLKKQQKKAKKEKKAQFFIIAALIGVIIIFSFFSIPVLKKPKEMEKIYDMGENFKFEMTEVIATGKIKKMDVNQLIDNSSREFLKYGLTIDPYTELVYIFGNASNYAIFNFADENIISGGEEIVGGRKKISSTLHLGEIKKQITSHTQDYPAFAAQIKKNFQSTLQFQQVTIRLGTQTYNFTLSSEEQFYVILRIKKENETFIAIQ